MSRSTVHYADDKTNNILRALHNKLRPAGTPVMRVEYIIELLLLRIFEVKLKHDKEFAPLRKLFDGDNYRLLFSHLLSLSGNQVLEEFNKNIFAFYGDILGKARGVFLKNLPQKVQDQLVLIEEVFSNSSFNNNVKNGNLAEIISLVNDINEERLLKTDLLGDAIESALSEQGGTRDVGLYRTPDHIRQMMVVMTDPSFKDIIFDPACGTGGFLFDAFQFVMEKVGKDENWPSEKAHDEIREYLKKYIKKIEIEMPSSNIANTFYRVGISGIEYLGMIRKMAAVNLFIRGLNPANIEQGDSLDLFDSGVDAGTKSVVIANPPFGAELDQPAYPNVWEEYPKTDSTTLFIRLMFNHLKIGGRCAVVVSEGFLTWDDEPAREMRKILLEETNLKAIISLPQGVFVSKSGQGAKTSILYFEKGEPTKKIWYYKITNDGYSMGVNRKKITGCEIPEVLDLFTKYVKNGKTPPETKNSFTIPADWIKQIDPRLKQRIISDTTDLLKTKFSEKRKNEIEKLKEKLQKGKITKKEYDEKVWQFDNMVENNTQNEITKRVEKAHSFSLNLQTYKSALNNEQIKIWRSAFVGVKINNVNNIDARYQELKTNPEKAIAILASFNPESALDMSIAREYLEKTNHKDKKIKELQKVLKEGNKYPIVPLKDFLISNANKIQPKKYPHEQFIILGVSNTDGVFVNEKKTGSEIGQSYFVVEKNQFCYNPYRINVGSIGLNTLENGSRQIISGAYVVFGVNENEINPKYLAALFQAENFNKYVNEQATGGVRMNFKFEYLKNWQIPLPPLDIQNEIVEKVEQQNSIIEGAEKILNNFKITNDVFEQAGGKSIPLGRVCKFIGGSQPAKEEFIFEPQDGYIRLIQIRDFKSEKFKTFIKKNSVKKFFNKDDVMIARYGPPIFQILRGLEGAYNVALMKAVPDEEKLSKNFLFYFLQNSKIQNFVISNSQRSAGQAGVNTDLLNSYQILLPSLEEQRKIVEKLDQDLQTKERINLLVEEAKERIEYILKAVWQE